MEETAPKNKNVTNLDEYQMNNRAFDGETDSFRMSLVGAQINLTGDQIKMPEHAPVIVRETEYKTLEVPRYIVQTEYKTIEVPVIVEKIQIQTVEKPIIVTEIKVIEIEKPVIIRDIQVIESKTSELPMIAKICMVVQALALIGILLTKAI